MRGTIGIRYHLTKALGCDFSVAFVTVELGERDPEDVLEACRGFVSKAWGSPGTFAACGRVFAAENPEYLADVVEI